MDAGTDITLECASDTSASSITWLHDAVPVTNTPCIAINARYVTESNVNDCYLTALGNYSVQGPYTCHDHSGMIAQAVAIVIGNFKFTSKVQINSYVITVGHSDTYRYLIVPVGTYGATNIVQLLFMKFIH